MDTIAKRARAHIPEIMNFLFWGAFLFFKVGLGVIPPEFDSWVGTIGIIVNAIFAVTWKRPDEK